MRMMLPQRNVLTVLRGPCGWLSVAFLTVAAFLLYTSMASAQQTSTEATLSAPELTAEAGESAVGLSWTAVIGAERYELWVWTSADGWQQIGGDNLTDTSYNHTGLAAGTTYYYTVRAVNAGGVAGPWSEYASVTFEPSLATPTLTAEAGESAVELSWTAVQGAERYELWVWTSADGWQQIRGNNLTGTTYSHAGLTASTTYYFTIRAVNAAGETGPWSEYVSATPQQVQASQDPQDTPTATSTAMPRIQVQVVPTATSTATPRIQVQVAPTATPTATLVFLESVVLSDTPTSTATPTVTQTPTAVPTATPTATPTSSGQQSPVLQSTATPTVTQTGDQNSPATGVPTISGTAQVCKKLTVDVSNIEDENGMDNARFQIHWVGNNGTTEVGKGGLLRAVRLSYHPDDASENVFRTNFFTVGSRDEGLTIYVRVFFYDDDGNREHVYSAETEEVSAAANPGKPKAPQQVKVVPRGSGELHVSWAIAPFDFCGDGGSAVTDYKVQWKEAADDWGTPDDVSEATIEFESVVASHTISGLTDGVEYAVRIRATNAIGSSDASMEVTATPNDSSLPVVSIIGVANTPTATPTHTYGHTARAVLQVLPTATATATPRAVLHVLPTATATTTPTSQTIFGAYSPGPCWVGCETPTPTPTP